MAGFGSRRHTRVQGRRQARARYVAPVELVALGDTDFLAMERGYAEVQYQRSEQDVLRVRAEMARRGIDIHAGCGQLSQAAQAEG